MKYLEEKWEVNVLGVSNDGKQIHVESRLGLDEQCTMEADQQHLAIQAIDDPVITVSTELENKDCDSIQVTKHFSTVDQLQKHLAQFWTKRWWESSLPQPSDWDRRFQFCEVYMEQKPEVHGDITTAH